MSDNEEIIDESGEVELSAESEMVEIAVQSEEEAQISKPEAVEIAVQPEEPEDATPDFSAEEAIISILSTRFKDLTATIQRNRRIWVEIPRRYFLELLTCLHDELGFVSLCTITGLDLGDQFQLIYHLAEDGGMVVSVKQNAPRTQPSFETATDIYKGGVLYELEVRNLFGLTISGIPEDINYPIPDNWPNRKESLYPLRKDWVDPFKPDESGAAKKENN